MQLILNQAISLHQRGQLAEAERLYKQVLAAAPQTYQIAYLYALLLYQAQRLKDALGAADRAIKLNPEATEAQLLRGAILQALGQYDDAAKSFARVTARQPQNAEAWYNQGVALAAQGRHENAVAAFDRSLQVRADAAAWNSRGSSLHALGRNDEALESCDKALVLMPNFANALYNKGTVLLALSRFEEAAQAFDAMLRLAPGSFEALNNLGVALRGLDRNDEALARYDQALALNPGYAPALKNRGLVLAALERYQEALGPLEQALAVAPDDAEAWIGQGEALRGLRRHPEAIASFRRALELAPDDAEKYSRLAAGLHVNQQFDEALAMVEKAMALEPENLHALMTRGSLLCETGRVPEGFETYRRRALVEYGGKRQATAKDVDHKKRHDAEQRAWLAGQGVTLEDGGYHVMGGERLNAPAINPANGAAISAQWEKSNPQIVVIDDLLTQEALEGLRRFCWGSTVWKRPYSDGYLGAMPPSGFACPLLAQIADEFRTVFPAIFGTHGLGQLWGFKYDSSMSGIRLHADQAVVNVNFWITPDEANLNPENGGLVVWDRSAPLDWDFQRYNGDEKASREFLTSSGSRPVTVPYRANRAVIFDSDLFHETDKIEFQQGYTNRRINITMLYGRRNRDGS